MAVKVVLLIHGGSMDNAQKVVKAAENAAKKLTRVQVQEFS